MKLKIIFVALAVLFLNACDNQESVTQQSPAQQSTETPAEQNTTAPVEQMQPEVVAQPPAAETQSQEPQQAAVAAVSQPLSGEAVYKKTCIGWHASGAANAPRLGDKAAWKPRIAKGMDALLNSAINGVPGTAMMKRGTCASCSDDDLKAAVEYMVSQSK